MRSNQFVDKVCALLVLIDFSIGAIGMQKQNVRRVCTRKVLTISTSQKRYLSLSKPDRFRWSAGTCRGYCTISGKEGTIYVRCVCFTFRPLH